MGGSVNRYTLSVVVNESKIIPIAKGSLEMIDEVTSGYNDKYEFLDALKETYNIETYGKSVRIIVTYNQNKKVRYIKVLYANDKGALNTSYISEKILMFAINKDFVIEFVNRYKNNPYLSQLRSEVINSIKLNEDYFEPLQRILDLTFSSYKSIRDIYIFIKKYEVNNTKQIKAPTLNAKQDLTEALKSLKVMCEYQQLDFFDLLNNQKNTNEEIKNQDKPKIKQIKR